MKSFLTYGSTHFCVIADYVSVGEMIENGYKSDCVAESLGEGHSQLSKSILHHNPTDTYAVLLNTAKQSSTTIRNV